MSPFRRMEAAIAASFTIFMIGGLTGLLALWVSLSTAPAIVTHVALPQAAMLFSATTLALIGALALVAQAANILRAEWFPVAMAIKIRTDVRPFTAWVMGAGPLMAFSFLLLPAFAATLLSISPWLALGVVGAAYALLSSIPATMSAIKNYHEAKTAAADIRVPIPQQPIVCNSIMALIVAVVGSAIMVIVLDATRPEIDANLKTQLDRAEAQLSARQLDDPKLEALYVERVEAETRAFDHEAARRAQGRGSELDVEQSRSRLLALKVEAQRSRMEAADRRAGLEREIIELKGRRQGIASAAPALAK